MPISMAVFGGDAFTQASMIRGIKKRPYVPNMLDAVIGFEPVRATTDTAYIISRESYVNLIASSLRGSPIEVAEPDDANARPIRIPRFAKGGKLYAHELANIMPFEDETETDRAMAEVARIQNGLIADAEATMEHQRLGAVSGILLDAKGKVIVNFWDEFEITQPAAIDILLDNPDATIGEIREAIATYIVMPLARASKAGNDPRFGVRALCGDAFWFKLTGHPAVVKTYENYAAAAELRNEKLWTSFPLGGVMWFHYRGTDDNSTIAIASNTAKVFPVGVPGMWQHIMGPMNESIPLINQPGLRYYPFLERDKSEKQQWVQPEIYTYPLMVNARPDLVQTVEITT